MATITFRPRDYIKRSKETPEVWGCHVFMREDGTFEMSVKGETGLAMLSAALDALRRIDKLRSEPRLEYRHEGMAETLSSLKTQVSF